MTTRDSRATDAIDLANQLELELRRHPAAVRGAALAQLLAIWLASHPEQDRQDHLEDHIASVRHLVPIVLMTRQ